MQTEGELANGLVVGHAYSVTGARTVCIKLCCKIFFSLLCCCCSNYVMMMIDVL